MKHIKQKIKDHLTKLLDTEKVKHAKKLIPLLGLDINLAEILEDGTVNYNGSIFLQGGGLKEIPLKFGVIKGDFGCAENHLTSLKNCPHTVEGDFFCSRNKLTSLEFMPKIIGGTFFCRYNELTTLKHCPEIINGEFDCSENQLTTLEYCPKYVAGSFDASENNIETLKFFPKEIKGDARLICNYVQDISTLPRTKIGGEFLIGGLRFVCENDDERNTPVKVIEDSELEFKFKSDEVNDLKDSLNVELNKPSKATKRKMKI